MRDEKDSFKIKSMFPIREKQHLYIVLDSSVWSFKPHSPVYLCLKGYKIKMSYLGCGNAEGNPLIILTLNDSKYKTVEEIYSLSDSEMYLERSSED